MATITTEFGKVDTKKTKSSLSAIERQKDRKAYRNWWKLCRYHKKKPGLQIAGRALILF